MSIDKMSVYIHNTDETSVYWQVQVRWTCTVMCRWDKCVYTDMYRWDECLQTCADEMTVYRHVQVRCVQSMNMWNHLLDVRLLLFPSHIKRWNYSNKLIYTWHILTILIAKYHIISSRIGKSDSQIILFVHSYFLDLWSQMFISACFQSVVGVHQSNVDRSVCCCR